MPAEPLAPEPKPGKVIARILVPLAWTIWGLLLIGAFYALIQVSTERTTSPEAGRGLGIFAVLFLLALLAIVGVLLNVAVRKQSTAGIIVMTLIVVWPMFALVARPIILAYKERQFEKEQARSGDFSDKRLAAMAGAIARNDAAALAQLLNGQPPPPGKDRAGNDLLAYALVHARDRNGSAASVRVLLDAGADPKQTRIGSGEDVLNYMAFSHTPDGKEVMRLLIERGADPNLVDPHRNNTPLGNVSDPEMVRLLVEHGADIDYVQSNGNTPVVNFIRGQEWESALYLIEKGANLDAGNADPYSVEYFLKEWKDSIYGAHPEGWDRVREAIAARRAARFPS